MLTDEDKALFRQAVQQVKPLKKGKISQAAQAPRQTKQAPSQVAKPQSPVPENNEHPHVYLSNYVQEEVLSQSILSYNGQPIPIKRMRELKQGRIRWESRLDLHGLRLEEAQQALVNFIINQTNQNHRCLLIIHGKGSRDGEAPILKNQVNHWLRQFPQVLAFHSALSKDGGAGALYVLLKRKRNDNYHEKD
jgi:DNA-nicking Smr family endonuclease